MCALRNLSVRLWTEVIWPMIWTCGGLLVLRYDRGAQIFQISSSPFKIFGVKCVT